MKLEVKETINYLESVIQPNKQPHLQINQIEHIIIGSITRLIQLIDEVEKPWVMTKYIDVLDNEKLEDNIKKAYLLDVNHVLATMQCIIKQKHFHGYENSIEKRISDGSLAKLTYHLKSIL